MAAPSASTSASGVTTQTWSFMQLLHIIGPVVPSSPCRLPSLGSGDLLPPRFAKSPAPFPTVPIPAEYDTLYLLAHRKDPEEARRERNRKKKERKERNKALREAGEAVPDADASPSDVSTTPAAAPSAPTQTYGLPANSPPDFFAQFSARYSEVYRDALELRSKLWALDRGEGTAEPEQWGNVILHDAGIIEKVTGKKPEGQAGFGTAEDGTVELHWLM
ncbi:hypothetical protein JCM8097_007995 [Rhodosporidiobolus ruineniae]